MQCNVSREREQTGQISPFRFAVVTIYSVVDRIVQTSGDREISILSPSLASDIKRSLITIHSLDPFVSAVRSILTLVCPLSPSSSTTSAFCIMLASLLVSALALPVLIDAVPLSARSQLSEAVGVNVG